MSRMAELYDAVQTAERIREANMTATQLELLPTSQAAAILAYLRSGSPLTPLEALHKFGCFRLGARVWDLKQAGYRIETTIVAVGGAKRVASYTLKP